MNDKTRLAKDGRDVRISQRGRVSLNIQVSAVLLQVPSDMCAGGGGGDREWWCSSRAGLSWVKLSGHYALCSLCFVPWRIRFRKMKKLFCRVSVEDHSASRP